MFRNWGNYARDFEYEKIFYKGNPIKKVAKGIERVGKGVITLGGSERERAMKKQMEAQEEQARQEAEMFRQQQEAENRRRAEERARAEAEAKRAREEQARLMEETRRKQEAEKEYARKLTQDTGNLVQANVNATTKPNVHGNMTKIDYSGSVDKRFDEKDEEEKEKLRKAFRVR